MQEMKSSTCTCLTEKLGDLEFFEAKVKEEFKPEAIRNDPITKAYY